MSQLWIEIETLALNGVPMNPAQGRHLAQLTEMALTRLLERRGTDARISTAAVGSQREVAAGGPAVMRVPSGANEARWAEELALSLYRALDRTL